MTNQITVDFVKKHEGSKLLAYQDSGGVWTIGVGATGPDIKPGVTWTQAQVDNRLAADLAHAEASVRKLLKKPATDSELAAMTSFVFNLGAGALASSHFLELFNAGDTLGAAQQFPRWDHVGKSEVKGLLIRRFHEALLFLGAA